MAAETHLSEVRVDPLIMNSTNQDVKNQRSLWLRSIMTEVIRKTRSSKSPGLPKIPKVPHEEKNENEESYHPIMIPIGPYHYSDRTMALDEVEKLKLRMTRQFILDSGKDIEMFYDEVEKVSQTAREFYDESSIEGFVDEQFNRMMFLDGCFVLQFIHCITRDYEKLEMSDQQVVHVKRDLVLLENQLPFPVLESLASLRYEKHENDNGMKLIYDFLALQILQPREKPTQAIGFFAKGSLVFFFIVALAASFIYVPSSSPYGSYHFHGISIIAGCLFVCEILFLLLRSLLIRRRQASRYDWQPDQQPAHLLGLLHSIFIGSGDAKTKCRVICGRYFSYLTAYCGKSNSQHVASGSGGGNYLYYSAKDLKKVGIHFSSSGTTALTDVKFKSSIFYGTLTLPAITTDLSTKSMLLNLVAYETSSITDLNQSWVTSYICFMDSLINDAEDVKELRSKGILINYLGPDQQVADLFNHLCSCLEPNSTRAYNDVKRQINEQSGSILKKWIAQCQQTYFSNPWAFIAFVAAAVGLALTSTQTYYTIHPPKKG